MSDLMLDVGLAEEIKMAARRAGATGADLKALSAKDTFARILPVLRGLAEVVVTKRLRRVGTVSIPRRRKKSDPREFFTTRDGLYVWNDFHDRILPVVTPVQSVRKASLPVFELTKAMTDEEIRTELGNGHVFEDASVFCLYLEELLMRQKNGESGDLRTDGYATIFYVRGVNSEVFAVSVHWSADDRQWLVRACRLDGFRCFAGYRVLSAATADA